MPWKVASEMDEKLLFIAEYLRDEAPMTVLCERYGISRETGYVWKRRYEAEGVAGLAERSRAPHRHGTATPADLVVRLIALRNRKPYWGPKKLLTILATEAPEAAWPSASTVATILSREGLSEPRRRRRRALTIDQPFADVAAANNAWCIDFKGWFPDWRRHPLRSGDGDRCVQPVFAGLADRGAGHRGRGAGRGPALSRAWVAASDPQRQRAALCLDGGRRTQPAVGALGQNRHSAGADLSGQAAAEPPPRTHAPDAESGNLRPTRRRPQPSNRPGSTCSARSSITITTC